MIQEKSASPVALAPDAVLAAGAQQVGSGSLLSPAFLALGTFAIGTEGFMIAPLLPDHRR